jgi:uncharacterized membrane protein YqiK
LGELSAPLHSLIEFLGIDEDLVQIAAADSAALDTGPRRKELDAWIRNLPQTEKDDLLVSAVSEPNERWKNDLLRRFQRQNAAYTSSATSSVQRRTAGNLLAAVHARAEERDRLLNAKRAAEAAQRKAEDEAKRAGYLDQLGKREAAAWNQIAAHIQKRQADATHIQLAAAALLFFDSATAARAIEVLNSVRGTSLTEQENTWVDLALAYGYQRLELNDKALAIEERLGVCRG